jgi:hypothetical protein
MRNQRGVFGTAFANLRSMKKILHMLCFFLVTLSPCSAQSQSISELPPYLEIQGVAFRAYAGSGEAGEVSLKVKNTGRSVITYFQWEVMLLAGQEARVDMRVPFRSARLLKAGESRQVIETLKLAEGTSFTGARATLIEVRYSNGAIWRRPVEIKVDSHNQGRHEEDDDLFSISLEGIPTLTDSVIIARASERFNRALFKALIEEPNVRRSEMATEILKKVERRLGELMNEAKKNNDQLAQRGLEAYWKGVRLRAREVIESEPKKW